MDSDKDHTGSRWTLQAMLMNGKIGNIGWEIKPDQMQTVHPLLAILFISFFDPILYPLLVKFGIRRPLQNLIFSCFVAVLAFLLAAVLQYKIMGEHTVIPADERQLVVYNGLNCEVSANWQDNNTDIIGPLNSTNFRFTPNLSEDIVNIIFKLHRTCNSFTTHDTMNTYVTVSKGKSISYFLSSTIHKEVVFRRINHYDNFEKPKSGHPNLRIIINNGITNEDIFFLVNTEKKILTSYNTSSFTDEKCKEVTLGKNQYYTLQIKETIYIFYGRLHTYFCMIITDVIFTAMAFEFSFTEAPPRVKSFVASCMSMTQSLGNLIVVIILTFSFRNQVHEYMFFTGLMLANTLLLIYLSYNYEYKSFKQQINHDDDDATQLDTK